MSPILWEERFLPGPIMVFGDRLLDALCWPANKPYADRLCDIWVLWPAMISQDFPCFLSRIFLAIFYLYADRPLLCFCYMLTGQVQSPWLYILWTFIFGLVFAVWWPTYFCSLASTYLTLTNWEKSLQHTRVLQYNETALENPLEDLSSWWSWESWESWGSGGSFLLRLLRIFPLDDLGDLEALKTLLSWEFFFWR